MAILDELLGNGNQDTASVDQSHDSSSTDFTPNLDLGTGKILDFDSSNSSSDNGDNSSSATHLTGIDGLNLGISAPFHTESTNHTDTNDVSDSHSDGGGLLGGLV